MKIALEVMLERDTRLKSLEAHGPGKDREYRKPIYDVIINLVSL
jgi:hypothetical protein